MSTMLRVHMRAFVIIVLILGSFTPAAFAQDPPKPIPWVVVDLHASIPRLPTDDGDLALSRNLVLTELPGAGLGGQIGLHVYPLHTRVITIGVGGELMMGRSRQTPAVVAPVEGVPPLRSAEETITSFAPELSLNFGNGSGWSYLSSGLGQSIWSLSTDDLGDYPPNHDKLKTFNYGGGARWFIRPHLAFSFDARFYVISPGFAYIFPATPRVTLFIIAAGVSIK
jgi:hypothetical protein